jgi:hypothetical protein
LVAAQNTVTVFERDDRPGGAFRYAGKAPLFQEVVANQDSFDRTIAQLVAACTQKGVTFRYGTDATRAPNLLAPFDRIVIASGAQYRFGLGRLPARLLDRGAGRWPLVRQLFAKDGVRDWFYYRARRGTGAALRALARPGQNVAVIGDAAAAGKSRQAILSAFEAALTPSSG